jgi:hypothetical protein
MTKILLMTSCIFALQGANCKEYYEFFLEEWDKEK